MSDKKIRNAIDSLRGDVQELAEAFWVFRDNLSTLEAVAAAEHQQVTSKSAQTATVESLEDLARETGEPGYVSAFGAYQTDGEDTQLYRWSLEAHSVQDLLSVSADSVAHVLAALGNQQRLSILLMMLAHPATATDVVTALSLGTTGAAYHHLNVLQAAGLVEQKHRGVFTIVPSQTPVILTILAAFSGKMATEVVDVTEQDEATEATLEEETKSSSKKERRKAA